MASETVRNARMLLAIGAGGLEEIKVFFFDDDDDAHDDQLQAKIEQEFVAAFDRALAELTDKFGPPANVGDQDEGLLPLAGVFRFAVWTLEENQLFLAAAHEDRELPYLLMLGTL